MGCGGSKVQQSPADLEPSPAAAAKGLAHWGVSVTWLCTELRVEVLDAKLPASATFADLDRRMTRRKGGVDGMPSSASDSVQHCESRSLCIAQQFVGNATHIATAALG